MSKVFKKVSKAVFKPIRWVGDQIADVGDWVVEEIVEPVAGTVTDVVDAVLDDPIKAVAQITAIAFQQYWALPLIEGADVAIEGGSIGDVLEATAIAYVAGEAGSYAGNYAGSAAAKAGANATAARIIGSGTGAATNAVVRGQDPVQAFVTGGVQAGVSAGLGYIDSEISGDTSTGAAAGDPGGAGDPGPVGQTQSFFDQYPTVKNVIADTLTATLSGQDVTGATVMNAVTKAKVTTETVKGFIDTDNLLTDGQIALITTSIQNVANATFSGADASDALLATINAYGTQELNKVIDKNVKNTIDKVTGDYQKAEAQANKLDAADEAYRKDVQTYNGYVADLQSRINIRDGIKSEVDSARATLDATDPNNSAYGGLVDAYNAKVKEFNAYSAEVDKYYTDTIKPATDPLKASIDAQYAAIEDEAEIYQTLKDELVSSADQLDDVMVKVDNATQKAYVRAMTGDEFNVEEYKNVNGLSDLSDDDARFHWLTEGKDNNLPVNAVQYKTEFDNAVTSSMQGTLEAIGLSITDLTPAQIKFLREQTEKYGDGNLQSVRDIQNGSALLGQTLRDTLAKNVTSAGVDDKTKAELVADYPILEGVNLKTLSDNDFDALPKNVKDKLIDVTTKSQTKQKIIKPADVSDADILSGNAKVNTNAEGLLEWGKIDVVVPTPKWSSKYGQIVTETERYNGSFYEKTITGFKGDKLAEISGFPNENGVIVIPQTFFDVSDPERTKSFNETGNLEEGGNLRFSLMPVTVDLSHLKETNPGSYLDTLADVSADAVDQAVQAGVAGLQEQYEFAKNLAIYIEKSLEGTAAGELGASIANSDFNKNTAGLILDAGGELLQTFNDVLYFAGINPDTTPAGKLAKEMIAMGGDLKTSDWKAASENINKIMDSANYNDDGTLKTRPDGSPIPWYEQAFNKAVSIKDAIGSDPIVFASEFIGKEILQEAPVYLLSAGLGNVAGRAAKFARYGKEFSEKLSKGTKLTTSQVLDLAESIGGSTGSAFDDAYATAIKAGYNKADAEVYALEKATTTGLVAGLTNVVTNTTLGGADLQKIVFGDKKVGSSLTGAFDIFVKEARQEALEEGIPQAYLESQLYKLDPTRDVVGNVVGNSLLGAISGGGTGTSIYGTSAALNATGDAASNALMMFNPEVRKIVQNEDGLDAAGVTQRLNDLGVSDNAIQSNILNTLFDTDYTSAGEAAQAAYDYATENNIQYKFTKDELTDFTGANADADIAALLDNYVDPRYLDAQEAINAAAAEGVTLTEEQAQQYVRQTNEIDALVEVTKEFDSQATTYEEAKKYLGDLGYNPTDEEINTFVGQVNETEQETAISAYVGPRQTTEAEVRKAFADQGYDPTDEEVAARVGQGGDTFETDTITAVDTYVGPRQITEAEVRKAFADQGYDPTDAEVAERVGQGGDTFEADTITAVDTYIDPRQVTAKEVTDAYAELGLTRPTDDDIQALVGQYMETDLAGKAEESLPTARYNSIINILDSITGNTGETGVSDDVKDAIDVVKSDMINALGDLGLEVANIDQAVTDIKTAVDALPVGASPEDVNSAIDDALKNMNNLSTEDVSGIVNAALADMDTLSSEDVQGIVDTAVEGITETVSTLETDLTSLINQNAGDVDAALEELAGDLNTTEAALLEELGTTKEELETSFTEGLEGITETVSTLETDLTSLINQNAGDVDAALEQLASDLGTTEDALLSEIGTTRETLTNQFTEQISTLETDLTSLINQNAGDVDAALEQLASDLGTTEDALLTEIGTTRETLSDQFTEGLSTLETDLTTLINQNAGDVDAALEQLASDLGTTEDALLAEIGTTRETLSDQFTEGLSTLETDLTSLINQNAGDVDVALEQLASDLGTTEDALLAEIGTTRETLTNQFTEQVSTLETDLTTLINQNAGDVDAALEQLSSDLGTTEEALLAEIGTNRETLTDLSGQLGDVQTALGDQIGDVEAALGVDIQAIADLIGKPATEVTDVDIDFVADLIAQQEALSDPSTFEFTNEQLGYDVTGDGIVDINDQNLLNNALQGQDVAFAPESQFESATGIFAQLDAQNQAQMDVQAQIQAQLDAQTQAQTDAQLQIAQQIEDEGKMRNVRDLQGMLLEEANRTTAVKSLPVADIGPAYNFESIFRNPDQDAFYRSPYVEGGVVDANEELLRLIGGK